MIDISDVTCDFETDFKCGYTNDPAIKKAFWVRYTGFPDTAETGPSNDVTTGSLYGI